MVGHALRRRERRVDRQAIFSGQMGDDGFAVADGLAVIDDIGQLPARRGGSVEDMLMDERHSHQLEEGKHLQPVAVVVGDAE